MKKYLIVLFLLASGSVHSQKIKVVEEAIVLERVLTKGYSVVVDLDVSQMQKKWIKQLKTYGKLTREIDYIVISPAVVPSVAQTSVVIYTKTTESLQGLKIWMCIANANKTQEQEAIKSEEAAQKILHDFAATNYTENINEQIKHAEAALVLANKNQEKAIRKSEYLENQISKNKENKLLLEEKLKKNGEDLISLKKEQQDNVIDKQKTVEEVERMKRATEIVKAKLNEIY